jgi:hypothetical protein
MMAPPGIAYAHICAPAAWKRQMLLAAGPSVRAATSRRAASAAAAMAASAPRGALIALRCSQGLRPRRARVRARQPPAATGAAAAFWLGAERRCAAGRGLLLEVNGC